MSLEAARVAENGLQDRQASDPTTAANPTEGRLGRPTCGSLHLEVLRRGFPLVCNLFIRDLLALVEGGQTGLVHRRNMDESPGRPLAAE